MSGCWQPFFLHKTVAKVLLARLTVTGTQGGLWLGKLLGLQRPSNSRSLRPYRLGSIALSSLTPQFTTT